MPRPTCRDELGVLHFGVAHQDSFGYVLLVLGYRGGQHVECLADRGDVVVVDLAVLDGGGQVGQFGRQLGSGQGAAAAGCGRRCGCGGATSRGGDAQALPQQFGDDGACGQFGIVGAVGRFDAARRRSGTSARG